MSCGLGYGEVLDLDNCNCFGDPVNMAFKPVGMVGSHSVMYVFIAASEAVKNRITPRYRASRLWVAFNWLVLMPTWAVIGIFAAEEVGTQVGMGIGISLAALHLFSIRFRSNARKEIKFRDQKGMISYARRLRRGGAKLTEDNIPVANHLLINGLLVSVNGNVFDIGYPAWLFNRFNIEKEKVVKGLSLIHI